MNSYAKPFIRSSPDHRPYLQGQPKLVAEPSTSEEHSWLSPSTTPPSNVAICMRGWQILVSSWFDRKPMPSIVQAMNCETLTSMMAGKRSSAARGYLVLNKHVSLSSAQSIGYTHARGRRTASARSPARNGIGLALPTNEIHVSMLTLREYMLPLLRSALQSPGISEPLGRA